MNTESKIWSAHIVMDDSRVLFILRLNETDRVAATKVNERD